MTAASSFATDTEINDVAVATSGIIFCDGEGSVTRGEGHPRVYLTFDADGQAVCPYCSRRFLPASDAYTVGGHS